MFLDDGACWMFLLLLRIAAGTLVLILHEILEMPMLETRCMFVTMRMWIDLCASCVLAKSCGRLS